MLSYKRKVLTQDKQILKDIAHYEHPVWQLEHSVWLFTKLGKVPIGQIKVQFPSCNK